MGPTLELGPCVSAHAECFDVCPTALDARFQSASAIHLSPVGPLPPPQGPYGYHPAYRRSHASRGGPSARTDSLADSPARYQLRWRRTRANWAARTPRLLTSPRLRCGSGGLLTKTEPAVAYSPVRSGHFRPNWAVHPG